MRKAGGEDVLRDIVRTHAARANAVAGETLGRVREGMKLGVGVGEQGWEAGWLGGGEEEAHPHRGHRMRQGGYCSVAPSADRSTTIGGAASRRKL